jgi:hypothetical protein
MKLFHYAHPDRYQGIVTREEGLKPETKLGITPDLRKKKFVFALTDPQPEKWLQNSEFSKAVWHRLIMNAGTLLLDFDFDEQNQEAYVADWGHREGYLLGKRDKKAPERFAHASREEAEEAYSATMVELKKYLDDPELAQSYSLPEILVPGKIPADLIHVSEIQPEIERLIEFARENPNSLELYRNNFANIPELHRQLMEIDSHLAEIEGGVSQRG